MPSSTARRATRVTSPLPKWYYASNIPSAQPVYRGAILGINDPSLYVQIKPQVESNVNFYDENGDSHAISEDFGLESSSSRDAVQGFRAYKSVEGVEFDFTVQLVFSGSTEHGFGLLTSQR